MPDCHAGYGFAIGNMAAFDADDPKAVVSPGGVGTFVSLLYYLIVQHACFCLFCNFQFCSNY